MNQSLTDLYARVQEARAAGDLDGAIRLHETAIRTNPQSAVAEHNLAAALGDAGRWSEALEATRRAFAKGGTAGETWLVHARALSACDRHGEAVEAFEQALLLNPGLIDAYHELAQLLWMLTGDRETALSVFPPDQPPSPVSFAKAKALQFMGDPIEARNALEPLREALPGEPTLLSFISQLELEAGRPDESLIRAIGAIRMASELPAALEAYAAASLATGRHSEALAAAERLQTLQPLNQHAITLEATALRLMGNPRGDALYDYAAFVRTYTLDTPPGWPTLETYLKELANELQTVHPFRAHPFGQSVRHGSQRPDILKLPGRAIAAFESALAGPLAAYLAHLGAGSDPLRARNTGTWQMHGAWSVWLRPGGFHTDHVHPSGWISSACYVEVPDCVSGGDRAGWLRFGKPGTLTRPSLSAGHWIKPEPGQLALFPSYMWHGTEPFGGEQSRLTIAMDFLPGASPRRGATA